FTRDRLGSIWAQAEADNGDEVAAVLHPDNGRWVLGVIVLALLLMLSVHAQTVGRDLLQSAGGGLGDLLTRLQSNLTLADVRISILWSFIVSMFLLIGYFLAGGLWGNRATLQGYGLGVLLFIVLVQTSAGWYAAVFNAESPTESWDSPTTHRPYHLLRETLDDLMLRETSGFPYLPITVLRDRSVGLDEDGLLGWLLKDQPVQFVDAIEEARAAPLVIASASLTDSTTQSPDLGGSYVGQSFVLSRTWASTSLMGMDVLPWWMQRQTRIQPVPHQTVTLWVRQDVFESVPVTPLTSQAVGR
nr:hypothetical protein [Anaerolineae bacterium]